jgi:enterochelin esterase-like enzyme
MHGTSRLRAHIALWGLAVTALPLFAQQPPPASSPAAPDTCLPRTFAVTAPFKSVEVLADRRVTFRVCAPGATEVKVTSNDMPDVIPLALTGPAGLAMSKDAKGLWTATTDKPLAPDTYRYDFSVNGARVPDPQATTFSNERTGTNSTLEVPGPEGAFQTYDRGVPHGTVSVIEYWSGTLGMKRSAHVYTPPGYFTDSRRYPVLYLVHGAGDSDDSWTSVGRAHYILDNLIAAGKAKPMIIVMPFGHTPDRPGADLLANNDFGNDLIKDLIPYVDRSLRTIAKADSRAMAGLSMGGSHTIRNGLTHPELFHYVGIFSMGLGMQGREAEVAKYESDNAAALARSARELKLVYYAMGRDDFLHATIAPTRAMLDRQGIRHVFNESGGGHTWINWRRYLNDFAPRLFR